MTSIIDFIKTHKGKIIVFVNIIMLAACALYLYKTLANYDFSFIYQIGSTKVIFIFLLSCFAISVIILQAYCWSIILQDILDCTVSANEKWIVIKTYLRANIAKYLPGNVLPYFYRNILLVNTSINQKKIFLSSIIEYFIYFFITVIFIIIGILFYHNQIENIEFNINYTLIIIASVIVALVILYAISYIKKKQINIKEIVQLIFRKKTTVSLIKIFIIKIVHSLIVLVIFYFICLYILNYKILIEDFFKIFICLSIADYSSIITPGIPAGIGIKESVSLILLSRFGYNEAIIFTALLIHRFVFILSDIWAFLLSNMIKRNKQLLPDELNK
jgi:glycosyltransferase 2 family protein